MLEHFNPAPAAPARVVLLGSRGFVAGTVAARLQSGGVNVLALPAQDLDLLNPASVTRLTALLQADDALVFASALTPDRGRDIGAFMKNLTMARHVCDALAQTPVAHVVYISSDAVYHDDANPVTERSCCQPSSFHGMMHLARELMLAQTVKAPLAILRPSLLYGLADTHNGYGPNRFRRLAEEGKPITLFGEGEEMRDHVLVDDLAELVRLALVHRSAGVLNVATGQSASFRTVAETLAALFAAAGTAGVAVAGTPRANPVTHRHFDPAGTLKAFPEFRYTPWTDGARRLLPSTKTDTR